VRDFYPSLEARHALEEWRGRTRLDENLFVWRLLLPPDQFTGFVPHRIQHVDRPPWPPMIQSLWRRPSAAMESALLHLDAFECPSREAAHDLLVRLLGDVQSPLVARDETVPLGDVVFAGPGDSLLLFARANLVCVLRSAGRGRLPITGLAAHLDADFVRKPEPHERAAAAPAITRLEAEVPARKARFATLRMEAAEPAGSPLMYKFYSRSGEVLREDDRLLYRAIRPGAQDVQVYAAAGDRGHAGEASLSFELV